MAVRPASLTSKAHRRLTAALDRRHTRVNRVQHTVTVLDPKKAKSDREKQEEARIRSRRAPPSAECSNVLTSCFVLDVDTYAPQSTEP